MKNTKQQSKRCEVSRLTATGLCCLWILAVLTAGNGIAAGPYAAWAKGPSSSSNFFPLAVWLQNPSRAEEYREAGINTYVGLWKGPTEEQLAKLAEAKMKVICHQNEVGLRHRDSEVIIGWMHGDEPDNAQSLGSGKGYGPPIPASQIVADYRRIRNVDPTRPVLLNLGQGVAWDQWIGRGVRRNHPEDYLEYIQGCDIASFDIYPAVHTSPEVSGQLWYVARGVQRLISWSGGKQVVWNCLECTRISNPDRKPAPHEVRAEAWMSIIHGSRGLIYFVHQFKPEFREAALLDDAGMLAGVTKLNREITSLAPVINSPIRAEALSVMSEKSEVPVACLAKRHEGSLYVFAVGMRQGETTAAFALGNLPGTRTVEVLGEERKLTAKDGAFRDSFKSWDVHIYVIRGAETP